MVRKPDTAPIPTDWILNASFANSDGFGIIGKDEKNKIYVDKDLTMNNCENLIRAYEEQNLEFACHFRLATHGKIDKDNTHPFPIRNGKAFLMHNGVFSIPIINKDLSDTRHFCNKIDAEKVALTYKRLNNYFFRTHKQLVGSSKIVILGKDVPTMIFNKELGVMKEGIWLSNEYSIQHYYATTTSAEQMYGIDLSLDELLNMRYEDLVCYVEANPELVAQAIYYC